MSNNNTNSLSYVRKEMVPESAPPAGETGVVRWVRTNLIASPRDAVLTVLSLFVIYWVVSHVLPWMMNGIWDAGSLAECREIRNATLGEHVEVACFAVLTDRWHQIIFGFYPPEFYWRPILALGVLLAALAPVLYSTVSRKMLILTAVAPFLIGFLLWGGSIWVPVSIALGFVAGFYAFKFASQISSLVGTLAVIIVPILFWLFVAGPLAAGLDAILPIGLTFVKSNDFGGFMLSIVIGVAAITLSMPLGVLLALGRQSNLFVINKVSVAFIEVIRGIPLIVWLFTASTLLNYFMPPGTNFDLMLRVIIMVTLFSAAYIAEVIRGGLAALPKGQYEGGDSLGLNYWQSMRLLILPQALKISIPGIVNTFIGLFKDTTLVLFIGMFDPIGFVGAIRASTDWNGVYWEPFLMIAILFFICCFSMGRYSLYLEKKLQRDHR